MASNLMDTILAGLTSTEQNDISKKFQKELAEALSKIGEINGLSADRITKFVIDNLPNTPSSELTSDKSLIKVIVNSAIVAFALTFQDADDTVRSHIFNHLVSQSKAGTKFNLESFKNCLNHSFSVIQSVSDYDQNADKLLGGNTVDYKNIADDTIDEINLFGMSDIVDPIKEKSAPVEKMMPVVSENDANGVNKETGMTNIIQETNPKAEQSIQSSEQANQSEQAKPSVNEPSVADTLKTKCQQLKTLIDNLDPASETLNDQKENASIELNTILGQIESMPDGPAKAELHAMGQNLILELNKSQPDEKTQDSVVDGKESTEGAATVDVEEPPTMQFNSSSIDGDNAIPNGISNAVDFGKPQSSDATGPEIPEKTVDIQEHAEIPEPAQDEEEPVAVRTRSPIKFTKPEGFGQPVNTAVWNTPVITDFGYPFLNFSSEAFVHLFKTNDEDDRKRTFKKIKNMLKEAKKRYGGIWKAICGASIELFKKYASDPGTICVPNYLKVDSDLLDGDSANVTVTGIKYYSVSPSYEKAVEVPRAFLESFYDVLDYTKAFKTYVKFADGLTPQELADDMADNGGRSQFYLLVPKQAKYSRSDVKSGTLFSALFGGVKCVMLKTVFRGKRGCFIIDKKASLSLFSDIN